MFKCGYFKFGYLIAAAIVACWLTGCAGISTPTVYAEASKHIVELQMDDGNGVCAGVAISEDVVLTAAHCFDFEVPASGYVKVVVAEGEKPLDADVTFVSPEKQDLALVHVLGAHLNPATIRTQPLALGEMVFTIGHPEAIVWSLSVGHVSALSRDVSKIAGDASFPTDEVQLDMAVNAGNSGGGLFDMQGNLVGITNIKVPQTQGISFAVPVRIIEATLPQ